MFLLKCSVMYRNVMCGVVSCRYDKYGKVR